MPAALINLAYNCRRMWTTQRDGTALSLDHPVGADGRANNSQSDEGVYTFGGRTAIASTSIRKPAWASAGTPTDVLAGSAALPEK